MRNRNPSLKRNLFMSVFLAMAIVFLFAIICISITIRNYNEHYYSLISSVLDLRMDAIISSLKNYEIAAKEIAINDSLQIYLSELKDKNNSLRITTSNSIRTILSQRAARMDNVNTFVVIPTDKTAAVFQAMQNTLEFSDYIFAIEKLQDDVHGVWVTDYCQNGHMIYVCRINRIANVKLDTIGYLAIDVDISGAFSRTDKGSCLSEYSFLMMDNENNAVYSTNSEFDSISYELYQSASSDDFIIGRVEKEAFFIVVSSYSDWRFACLMPYSDIIGWLFRLLLVFLLFAAVLFSVISTLITKEYRSICRTIDALRLKFLLFSNENVTLPSDKVWKRNDELGELHKHFDQMTERVKALSKAKLAAEVDKRKTQIEMLQLQISPHFVLNSLQMLAWRAKKRKDQDLSEIIESLGRILQVSLSKDLFVYLDMEISLVQEYIFIQQKRASGRKIELELNIADGNLLGMVIPKFSIQPLVENACRYSDSDSDEVRIVITVNAVDGKLVVKVANTGSVFEDKLIEKLQSGELVTHGSGTGMLNILKRIEYSYGNGAGYGLKTYNENGMAVVVMTLPLKEEDERCSE